MKKYILVMIIALVIIAGCSKGGTRLGPGQVRNVRQGTEGLSMNFLENQPLDAITEGTEVVFDVEVTNGGAADIVNGLLYLGIEQDLLEIPYGYDDIISLNGRTNNNPNPESVLKTFVVRARELDEQTETIPTNIFVSACYQYMTESSFTVCVDTKTQEQVTQKACEVQDISSSGQGAPVAVTRVEPMMLGFDTVRPQFTIQIENRGNGQMLRLDKYDEACSSAELYPEDLNVVNVAAFLSEIPLQCQPSEVKLRQGTGIVRCTLEDGVVQNQPAFTTTLTVLLQYSYTTSISRQITIEDVNY